MDSNTGDEAPIYDDIGDKELWVPIIEKAYAKLNGKKYKSKYKKIEGGFGKEGIEAVTGKQASSFNPRKKPKVEVVAIILEALNDRRAITVGTDALVVNNDDRLVLSNKYLVKSSRTLKSVLFLNLSVEKP